MLSLDISDIAIIAVIDYHCIISDISKPDIIHFLKISELDNHESI